MPMDRSLYPANWEAIALEVKQQANWQCQECGQMCRQVGESLFDFFERMDWEPEFVEKPGQYVLTVAHLDHEPANCDRANLKALCSVCHCRYDLAQMPKKKMLKRERLGQLNLFAIAAPSPAGHGKEAGRIQLPIQGGADV